MIEFIDQFKTPMKIIIRSDYLLLSATKKSLPGFFRLLTETKKFLSIRTIRLLRFSQLLIYPCNNRIQRKRYDI